MAEKRCVECGEQMGFNPQNGFELNNRIYDAEYCSPTVRTFCGGGQEVKIATDIPSFKASGATDRVRFRKLTENECFRLMGVRDSDFLKVKKHQSKSSLYHLAGDSIITTCLMAIFGEILGVEYKEKIKELADELAENKKEEEK